MKNQLIQVLFAVGMARLIAPSVMGQKGSKHMFKNITKKRFEILSTCAALAATGMPMVALAGTAQLELSQSFLKSKAAVEKQIRILSSLKKIQQDAVKTDRENNSSERMTMFESDAIMLVGTLPFTIYGLPTLLVGGGTVAGGAAAAGLAETYTGYGILTATIGANVAVTLPLMKQVLGDDQGEELLKRVESKLHHELTAPDLEATDTVLVEFADKTLNLMDDDFKLLNQQYNTEINQSAQGWEGFFNMATVRYTELTVERDIATLTLIDREMARIQKVDQNLQSYISLEQGFNRRLASGQK